MNLKSEIWVKAELRRCEIDLMHATIIQKGDQDRGLVLIRVYRAGAGNLFYQLMRNDWDKLIWHKPMGESYLDDYQARDYQERQQSYDADLWVIEVEDPKGMYEPQEFIA